MISLKSLEIIRLGLTFEVDGSLTGEGFAAEPRGRGSSEVGSSSVDGVTSVGVERCPF